MLYLFLLPMSFVISTLLQLKDSCCLGTKARKGNEFLIIIIPPQLGILEDSALISLMCLEFLRL